ncbi:DUF3427 domain-containing protein [Streptomyces sp. NPDC051567]|uniref:DUF3427 domain-containing protein n=1 Tax=Streptomyces sp. NPDC051567 TaxID=3365660 RepID=UPI00378D062E
MPGPRPSNAKPVPGLHETLITTPLEESLQQLIATGTDVIRGQVSEESSQHVLTRHIADEFRQTLKGLSPSEQVLAANKILDALNSLPGARKRTEPIAEGPHQLLAVANSITSEAWTTRPSTPLSENSLITNSPNDPSLGSELRAELATADRIDLLCAFVKWTGLRVLEQPLKAAAARGIPIRVITTTYIGATEREALDRLVREFNAEVKVNYELRSTRLHAKAWLFRRNSGFDTCYVGSSNLSQAALLDGLEWNVRLSGIASPNVLRKFEATFDAYWSQPTFESYDPDRDAGRLDEALIQARGYGKDRDAAQTISLSGKEFQPYPHQRDMLERLEVERTLHGRHMNLLVAATGTGKTVMAALDFKQLRKRLGRNLRLLFIAHRKEILEQSLQTYRNVLSDEDFGDLFCDGKIPTNWDNVFASIQSLKSDKLNHLPADHFDVIVIDEFHHGTSPTYLKVLEKFSAQETLGLTATPERMDGLNIQDEFFDGRIAAEMRLWEAMENELLCPFHYFGIPDDTDMSSVAWKRGSYDSNALSDILTGNKDRAELVIDSIRRKLIKPQEMRALGFCVSVTHAHFMADSFNKAGFNAAALSGETSREARKEALDALKEGRLHAIFSVDLFNEGLDVPDVDTLLLLRPTSSATVFLQQLGRGLRRSETKSVLTVLDFIGQHRKEFKFEEQFRALTNLTHNRLLGAIKNDFPQPPSHCAIILEGKAKDRIIENIRNQISVNVTQLTREVKTYGRKGLSTYLAESGRDIKDVYRGKDNSWTGLLRRAGLLERHALEGEKELFRRVPAFLHVDDPARVNAYTALLADDAPTYASLDGQGQAYARMLIFSIWPHGRKFAEYQEALTHLQPQRAFREEIRQVLAHNLSQTGHVPVALSGDHSELPLTVHASYNREEILTALGYSALGGPFPSNYQAGVLWREDIKTDALLITLEKEEKDFSPQTQYKDYAMSEFQFHWETQHQTSESAPTGIRYQTHKQNGSHVLLFVRRFKKTDIGSPCAWMLLGPADYCSHKGDKPMGITWQLHHEIPADVVAYSANTD